jgi:putative RNA 2'-phosphotransferase
MTADKESSSRTRVSRYISYLLRHNPENLRMDKHGFVDIDQLIDKLKEHFRVNKKSLLEIVEKSERKRFEIVDNKIRALYGHSIPVKLEFEEDKAVKVLYHGTTPEAATKIRKVGLKPMKRRWVHLSPTIETAKEVGLRRTQKPVILEIDAEAARRNETKFYKATDNVYLCKDLAPIYVKRISTEVFNK